MMNGFRVRVKAEEVQGGKAKTNCYIAKSAVWLCGCKSLNLVSADTFNALQKFYHAVRLYIQLRPPPLNIATDTVKPTLKTTHGGDVMADVARKV